MYIEKELISEIRKVFLIFVITDHNIFGSDRSPRSQDVRLSVCLWDIMLKSTLDEFLRVLKVLKKGPRDGA